MEKYNKEIPKNVFKDLNEKIRWYGTETWRIKVGKERQTASDWDELFKKKDGRILRIKTNIKWSAQIRHR